MALECYLLIGALLGYFWDDIDELIYRVRYSYANRSLITGKPEYVKIIRWDEFHEVNHGQ